MLPIVSQYVTITLMKPQEGNSNLHMLLIFCTSICTQAVNISILFKVNRSTISIFYINICYVDLSKTIQMYSLAILRKYSLKENNSGWFSNNIYIMNNRFCSITFYLLLYKDIQ